MSHSDMTDETATVTTQHTNSTPPVGMVVDDDVLVRDTVAEVLEDVCDHVYRASDGVEGLEMLRQHPDISVIVTDISMPRLDGIAFGDVKNYISLGSLARPSIDSPLSTFAIHSSSFPLHPSAWFLL